MDAIDLQRFEAVRQLARKRQEIQGASPRAKSAGESLEELLRTKKAEVFGEGPKKSENLSAVNSLSKVNALRAQKSYFRNPVATLSAEEIPQVKSRRLGSYLDVMG